MAGFRFRAVGGADRPGVKIVAFYPAPKARIPWNSGTAGLDINKFPEQTFALAPASADANFRRYFRVTLADGAARIVMDAARARRLPTYLRVARLLVDAGVHASNRPWRGSRAGLPAAFRPRQHHHL